MSLRETFTIRGIYKFQVRFQQTSTIHKMKMAIIRILTSLFNSHNRWWQRRQLLICKGNLNLQVKKMAQFFQINWLIRLIKTWKMIITLETWNQLNSESISLNSSSWSSKNRKTIWTRCHQTSWVCLGGKNQMKTETFKIKYKWEIMKLTINLSDSLNINNSSLLGPISVIGLPWTLVHSLTATITTKWSKERGIKHQLQEPLLKWDLPQKARIQQTF